MRKLVSIGLISLCVSLPGLVQAKPLHLINDSDNDSTMKIKGICSSYLGEEGITRKGKDKLVSNLKIKAACFWQFPCKAEVYADDDCGSKSPSSNPIAKGTLTLDDGIIDLKNFAQEKYNIIKTEEPSLTTVKIVSVK